MRPDFRLFLRERNVDVEFSGVASVVLILAVAGSIELMRPPDSRPFVLTAATPWSHQAHEIDRLMQSSRYDLREDFLAIFRNYAKPNHARAEVEQLRDNLAARKEWLARFDEQHPP